jgi:hypothetical protein
MVKFFQASRSMTFVFDSLTDSTKKTLTNYLGINEESASFLIDITHGTPAEDAEKNERKRIDFV